MFEDNPRPLRKPAYNRQQRRKNIHTAKKIAASQKITNRKVGFENDHSLLEVKVVPDSLIELRKELQKPEHLALVERAIKGFTFEECLGTILAECNIAVDGAYEPDDLFTLAVKALRARSTKQEVHTIDKKLVNAELNERKDGSVTLEPGFMVAVPEDKLTGKEMLVSNHMIFMQKFACAVCFNREACIRAQQCLAKDDGGAEATKEIVLQ